MKPFEISSQQTTASTPPRPQEILRPVSPAARDYLVRQGNAIVANGGTGQDVQNFVRMYRGAPAETQRNALLESITDSGGNPVQDPNLILGLSTRAYQGVTFGFGDEITGLFSTLRAMSPNTTVGEAFSEGRDSFNEIYKAGTGSRVVDFIAEVAGGAVTGGAAFRAAKGAVPAAGALGRTATAAATGAAGGAVAGAGYAQGTITDRTKAALIGGTLGVMFGAGMSKGLEVGGTILKQPARNTLDMLGKVGDSIQHRLPGLGTSEDHALRTMKNVIQEEIPVSDEQRRLGVSAFDVVRDRINALRDQGVSPTIADASGEMTLGLLGGVLRHRTPIKQQLVELLGERQAGQDQRLTGALFNSIFRGDKFGLDNAYHAVRDMADARRTLATPFYETAHQQLVPTTDRMRQLLSNPRLRAAYEEGLRIGQSEDMSRAGQAALAAGRLEIPKLPTGALSEAANQGLIATGMDEGAMRAAIASGKIEFSGGANPLGEVFPDAIPVRAINYTLQGIGKVKDRLLEQARGANAAGRSSGTLTKEFMALDDQMDELLEIAVAASPDLGKARNIWSNMSDARNAVEAGRGLLNKAPEIIEDELAKLNRRGAGLSDFARLGVMQDVVERMRAIRNPNSGGRFADVASDVFGGSFEELGIPNNKLAQALRAAFGSDEMAQDFYRRAAAESRISRTASIARGGRPRSTSAFEEGEKVAEGTLPFGRGGTGMQSALLNAWSLARQNMVEGNRAFRQRVADDMSTFFTAGLDTPQALDNLVDDLEYYHLRESLEKTLRQNASVELGSTIGLGLGRGSAAVFGGRKK